MVDPVARARDAVFSGSSFASRTAIRAPIRDSWHRTRAHGIATDGYLPPIPLQEAELEERRRSHPLAAVWPLLRHVLRGSATQAGQILFLSDAAGHLLWTESDRSTRRKAERFHLLPGSCWSEKTAGTSGIGTALAMRRSFQVFGNEHYLSNLAGFACSAAPIHDPLSGELLGALDFTCALREARPIASSLVLTAVRLAESELRATALQRRARLTERYINRMALRSGIRSAIVTADGEVVQTNPDGWLPRNIAAPSGEGRMLLPGGWVATAERLAPGGVFLLTTQPGADLDRQLLEAPSLTVELLGRRQALVVIDGVHQRLSRRHSDIIAMLLDYPRGLSGSDVAELVYGPGGRAPTARVELARLRVVLGHRLASEPYRLIGSVRADYLDLERLLASAEGEVDVATLLDAYPGPLLPGSRSPGVAALRTRLATHLRKRIADSDDDVGLARWRSRHPNHDD